MSLGKEFIKGIWKENAVFKLLLGMCPVLAVTTSAENGLGMGLASTFVLVCSNIVVALLRKLIPSKVRIPAFIIIIATFVTVVQLSMEAWVYDLYQALGIFIPLIVVNCLILGRAEAFASKRPVLDAAVDGTGMGLGFTLALFILGAVREIFGSGEILGFALFGPGYQPVLLMILPPGAFISLGLLLAAMNKFEARKS
ncbi:MAG: electron transport complex subunit RsxE [Desulfuromonas sp.]|jgi:electron transport complex protein RnfE|nr:MAG: electron transport complex subunit RsxE [Desulfuromonas sp.]